ncbi:gliding motility lipoprotein GldB [Bacteroidia bacterium]|nr:gliding motility lipoprotein GldB [Bacteroidia bacterium]
MMRIYSKILFIMALLISFGGCKGQSQAEPMKVSRFDKALFRLIDGDNDVAIQGELLCDYPAMLEVVGKGVLNMPRPEMEGFFDKLVNFYSEPTLKKLYRDALALYDSIPDIEQGLGNGFAYLKMNFPSMPIPVVYMHVSGLNQNVLVDENLLSVSIDKYMGKDYPLYRGYFPETEREKMQRPLIVPDYLSGWLLTEFPFTGKEAVLLERMVYEGKIKYLVSQALPDVSPNVLMGYTESSYNWCRDHEGMLWKAIIDRKHLYTPDRVTTGKYFEDIPATFLASEAPANPGAWIGWQIVRKYVEETGATPAALMQNTNAQDILTKSKYKPF